MNSRIDLNPLLASFHDSYRELLGFLTRRTGNREDARDLAQDVWLKLAERDAGRGATIDNPRAYVFMVAQNIALDHLRRHALTAAHAAEQQALQPGEPAAPDCALLHAQREALDAVERSLLALPTRTRDSFVLHRLEGVGQDELASRFGVSRSTVERDVDRASRAVDAALARWRDTPGGRTKQAGRRRALGTLFGGAVLSLTGMRGWQWWQHEHVHHQASLRTGRGQIARHTLPDGSDLSLDARSAVDLHFYGDRRAALLLEGSAFFAIAPMPDRPFSVATPMARLSGADTRFALDLRSDSLRVAVESGRLSLRTPDGEAHELTGGQGLRVRPGEPLGEVCETRDVAPWQRGWLSFRNEPLAEALQRLNRYADDEAVADPRVAHLPVSGEVRISEAGSWLRLLPQALPVRVETQGRRIVVAPKR